MTLTFDQTLIDHFAEEGYKPEFGARELKRLIRSELETALAREMLGGGIGKGDHASASALGRQGRTRGVRTQRATADPGRAGAAGCREGDRDAARRRWQRLAQEEVGERRILMAGEAAVSDPKGLAWAASRLDRGGVRGRGSRGRLQA